MIGLCVCLIPFVIFSNAEPHSLHRHCIASPGISYHKHIQFLMIDDKIIYYYNSSSNLGTPMPAWMNHTEGIEFWRELTRNLKYNRHIMEKAVTLTRELFNHSHDPLYQAHGHCGWNSDGVKEMFMSHAYDGKDFVSFDVQRRTWIAAVAEAGFYKATRQQNLEDLNRILYHYETECVFWLERLLHWSATMREPKVPDISVFEKRGSSEVEVICHVTGFYPREVQVEWLGEEGLPLLQGVSKGEVLPNGDGSFQLRTKLTVKHGAQHSQSYSCLVLHSSMEGNVTKIWETKQTQNWRISILLAVIGCLVLIGISIFIGRRIRTLMSA